MRIAFNPSTVAALIAPPNNKDITFDLRGQNIFARGVKFQGTDTWRDIKINNISIDSNILDLRNGSNTTLTNINGVVTINSTWRPVVDNLTSDSTTSSLSANLGRVLAGLINSKSDSEHNHDDRYLRLTGGTMQLGLGLKFHADENYFGTNADARIISLLDNNDKVCDGGLIIDERGTLDGKEYVTELLRIRDSEFKWKGSNILHSGNSYIKENTITINGSSTTWENTWRTILVNDISIGKAPLNIKAGNGISLSESNGTITVTSTSSTPNILLHQYLSSTDTTWYPLIWGGSDHNNASDSTGAVYKSHDVLSWLTSSLTLYATNIQTNNIKNLSVGGGIYWNPYVESTTDGSDAASITLVKSGVAGGTTLVLSLMNDANDTILFKTNGSARLYHNSYPILTTLNTYVSNNKGYIYGNEITLVNNADTVDGYHETAFPRLVGIKGNTWNWNDVIRAGYYKIQSGTITNHPSGIYPFGMAEVITTENHNDGENRELQIYYPHSQTNNIAIWLRMHNSSTQGNGWGSWVGVPNTNGNVASATKLQTARSIWGHSFNGTADVNGTIYINNSNSSEGAIRLNNNVNSNARISAIDSQVIFNTDAAIRFGGTSWDWNQWAGLKYNHSNKTIYLGIADGSIFNANSALVGGTLNFRAGVSTILAPNINFGNTTSGLGYGLEWTCGDNDFARIKAGATGSNAGYLEIATADDGNEPIYVRQYTGVFSSVVRTLTLLDANGYTHFPSYINIGGNENNNSSPDRVWGSNSSDSYLRSYRTSALRVAYANSAGSANSATNTYHLYINYANTWSTWYWAGLSGQPSWLWGSNDGTNMYVWNPSNFRVAYAFSAGNADTVDGYHATDGRTFTGNINWSPNWNDTWSDGTNEHPWYGFDHRYPNTWEYSTTISDYFGMTIKTALTLRLDFGTLLLNSGNVGIGTSSPSYKLDVNGLVRASGFIHSSHNSNDSVLLAGGGYSQGVPVKYWSIEQIIINSSEAVYHQNRGGNYTFITKIESYINGACTLTLQFPSGYDSYNTMIWAMGRTNNSSPSDRANIYATIIYLSGSKYRLVLADDSTLNNGSCHLYFMCF